MLTSLLAAQAAERAPSYCTGVIEVVGLTNCPQYIYLGQRNYKRLDR